MLRAALMRGTAAGIASASALLAGHSLCTEDGARPRADSAWEFEKRMDAHPGTKRITSYNGRAEATASFQEPHSFVHSRRGEGAYEKFDVWLQPAERRTVALVQLGSSMCGHRGIVHGGATATVVDELFGWTAHRCGPDQPARIFTAYLHVDYKAPVVAGIPVVVVTGVERVEGRKIFMQSTVESLDGSTLFARAQSLFVEAATTENITEQYVGG